MTKVTEASVANGKTVANNIRNNGKHALAFLLNSCDKITRDGDWDPLASFIGGLMFNGKDPKTKGNMAMSSEASHAKRWVRAYFGKSVKMKTDAKSKHGVVFSVDKTVTNAKFTELEPDDPKLVESWRSLVEREHSWRSKDAVGILPTTTNNPGYTIDKFDEAVDRLFKKAADEKLDMAEVIRHAATKLADQRAKHLCEPAH